jgi:hypothetical protein
MNQLETHLITENEILRHSESSTASFQTSSELQTNQVM